MENEPGRFVDALPAFVWTALADGNVDFLNRRGCDYTGLSLDQARGQGWQTAIHPEDLRDVLERWQSILASGAQGEMEARIRRFDGEYRRFLISINPMRDAAGQVVKWYGFNTDIDDRKRAEEALRLRELNFRLIVDSIPAPVAVTTPTGEVEGLNRPTLEYFGKTFEELKGWKSSDVVHPDDLQRTIAAQMKAHETGSAYNVESRHRRADGIYRWFNVLGLPLRDTDGRILRWFHLLIDIDDRKRAEALLSAENRLLQMVARGHSLQRILEALCQFVESTDSGCHCSVFLVDSTGKRLEQMVSPSMPASFMAAMIGRPVAVDSSPSSMACSRNEQVIVADLTSETRWASDWCPMALAHDVRACWATPISSAAGEVLGAFTLYYDGPRTPTTLHQSPIEQFTHIARIAIERARNDLALRRSEARKAAILDSALDCIVTVDHESCITEFNPAAERTFGYRRDEVVGKALADVIIPPSLREKHLQGFARYLASGESQVLGKRMEMTAVRADGREFPVELAITRIPFDGPPAFTGYLRDITERKQAEEKLRRSEALLAEAQRLSSTGSFWWRAATDERTWSEELYRIYELNPAFPVTMEMMESRVHPEDLAAFRERGQHVRNVDADSEFDFRLLMPDGSLKYVHATSHPRRHDGTLLELFGTVQDVTERRLAEEALSKARSELAHVARVTSLGALTASIAHEVNQPLSGIIANASTCLRMLDADPPNVDGARETVRRTIRDGYRASDVITRLRTLFAKKGATIESMDLNEATREVIALSSSELQRNRVILWAELAADLPPVAGDRVQLQQVILNLLLNASDAMSGVDDRPRQLVIRTERDEGDRVRMTVRDAGMGFETRDVNRLFEAFYTTKSGGMGMGLSISRSIIEGHHGRLWAAPNDGPGATFAFSIPRRLERTQTDTKV